ncbi:MAG: hypothetical protein HOQ17_16110, partial [Gemmatimonadaceae bacterium]|nr:hypothetical protein [Gemmatimonadaceae bacterium]
MHRRIRQWNPRWSLLVLLSALDVACSTSPAPAPPPAPVPVGTSRPATPPPVATPAAPAVNLEALADDLFERTNMARRNGGLTALARSVNLMS